MLFLLLWKPLGKLLRSYPILSPSLIIVLLLLCGGRVCSVHVFHETVSAKDGSRFTSGQTAVAS